MPTRTSKKGIRHIALRKKILRNFLIKSLEATTFHKNSNTCCSLFRYFADMNLPGDHPAADGGPPLGSRSGGTRKQFGGYYDAEGVYHSDEDQPRPNCANVDDQGRPMCVQLGRMVRSSTTLEVLYANFGRSRLFFMNGIAHLNF